MTYAEAKKELKSYQAMEQSINQMQLWINDKKTSSNKLTSTLTLLPKGSPIHQDKMAEKLSMAIDIEAELQLHIEKMKIKQKEILQKVLKLEYPYQNIIFNIYIVGNTIEASTSIVGFSRTETYRKRDKGIELYSQI